MSYIYFGLLHAFLKSVLCMNEKNIRGNMYCLPMRNESKKDSRESDNRIAALTQ